MQGTSEATLSKHPLLGYYVITLDFDATGILLSIVVVIHSVDIHIKHSKSLTGPWQDTPLFTIPPPWNNTTEMFCYATKAHPELAEGPNQIAFSFICNTMGLNPALKVRHPTPNHLSSRITPTSTNLSCTAPPLYQTENKSREQTWDPPETGRRIY